ncbi:hypothetical protein F5Y16DRAFT_398748 [Xylariaceae sp. FL0255]|nr:hypothetical protein F5Y16DRAFT_398748 [Xylariaceae sp. FL0255]
MPWSLSFPPEPQHWILACTQMHISFGDPAKTEQLRTDVGVARKIAMAAILFQPAFDGFMPTNIPPTTMTGWNVKEHARLYPILESCKDPNEIWNLLKKQEDVEGVNKVVTNNRPNLKKFFINLKGKQYSTIEARFWPFPRTREFVPDCTYFIGVFINKVLAIDEEKLDRLASKPTNWNTIAKEVYGLTEAPKPKEGAHSLKHLKTFLSGTHRIDDAFWKRMEEHRLLLEDFLSPLA